MDKSKSKLRDLGNLSFTKSSKYGGHETCRDITRCSVRSIAPGNRQHVWRSGDGKQPCSIAWGIAEGEGLPLIYVPLPSDNIYV